MISTHNLDLSSSIRVLHKSFSRGCSTTGGHHRHQHRHRQQRNSGPTTRRPSDETSSPSDENFLKTFDGDDTSLSILVTLITIITFVTISVSEISSLEIFHYSKTHLLYCSAHNVGPIQRDSCHFFFAQIRSVHIRT